MRCGVPLFGDDCLASLKIAARGETLWMLQVLSHAATNLLSILCGLNLVYHWGEFKRQDPFCAALTLAPHDLGPRLNHALKTLDLTAVRTRLNRP